MIRLCEICGKEMELKTVTSKNHKNYGKVLKEHENKRFCSNFCQIEWQRKTDWEERVGIETADKIRKDTSERVKGDKNPSCNPETALKISESVKEYLKLNPRIGDKNPFFEKKHTDETKKFLSERFKGKEITDIHYENIMKTRKYGAEHHFWNSGSSFGEYSHDFNNKLKRKIKDRDNHCCSLCEKKTQKLAIHHIDYDKQNSNERNLITLCISCHSKTNVKRDYWKIFFCSLLNEKYDNMS